MSNKQKPTKEGLKAEMEAKKDKQVITDYKHIMKNFINPARAGVGLHRKNVDEY